MHTDRCDDEHLQEQGDACREPSWGSVGQLSWGSGCPPWFERWLAPAPHLSFLNAGQCSWQSSKKKNGANAKTQVQHDLYINLQNKDDFKFSPISFSHTGKGGLYFITGKGVIRTPCAPLTNKFEFINNMLSSSDLALVHRTTLDFIFSVFFVYYSK